MVRRGFRSIDTRFRIPRRRHYRNRDRIVPFEITEGLETRDLKEAKALLNSM
jgi:hypothetical protein